MKTYVALEMKSERMVKNKQCQFDSVDHKNTDELPNWLTIFDHIEKDMNQRRASKVTEEMKCMVPRESKQTCAICLNLKQKVALLILQFKCIDENKRIVQFVWI